MVTPQYARQTAALCSLSSFQAAGASALAKRSQLRARWRGSHLVSSTPPPLPSPQDVLPWR
eukprot:588619-Rhodomonas_salina.2